MRFAGRHVMCSLLLVFSMWLCLCVLASGTTTSTVLSASNTSTSTGNETTTKAPKKWYFISPENHKRIAKITMGVALVGALLNFVVILVMAIDPLKILRKGPWITILNLAVADLISCVSNFGRNGNYFFFSASNVPGTPYYLYEKISFFGWGFGVSGSFFILTFFMVQIFAITKFPMKSRYWFSTRKVVLICSAIWVFAFLLGFSQLGYLYFTNIQNLKILIAHIGILQLAVVVQVILNIQVIIEIIRSGRNVGNPQNNKHRVLAKTVIILTIILFITAFPYFMFKQMEYIALLNTLEYKSETLNKVRYLSYVYAPIAMLNFTVNPVLYSLRLPDYRRTLRALVCKSERKNFSPKRATTSKLTNMISLRSRGTSDTSGERKEPMHATTRT